MSPCFAAFWVGTSVRLATFIVSVMIARLHKIDSVIPNDIHETMFLGYSTRPNTRSKKF